MKKECGKCSNILGLLDCSDYNPYRCPPKSCYPPKFVCVPGPQGETGPRGETGPEGPNGETGPRGETGYFDSSDFNDLLCDTFEGATGLNCPDLQGVSNVLEFLVKDPRSGNFYTVTLSELFGYISTGGTCGP